MALSNAEKQARWREKHIAKRRDAQRIVNLLVRKQLTDDHVKQIAALLDLLLNNRELIRSLRRELRRLSETGDQEAHNAAFWDEQEKLWRALWLREHPGRTAAEYRRLLHDDDGEVWQWRRAKGHALIEAERRDWERDHPGQPWQEHQCGMTDREYTDYSRWLRQRQRLTR